MRFALVAALLLLGCSRRQGAAADGSASSTAPSTTAGAAVSATPAAKAFGAYCVEDGDCASAVCFHKRLKTANQGPEHRGGNDAVEHDGYCSLSCNSDADCPVPPTNGRCGARGMCKRPEP